MRYNSDNRDTMQHHTPRSTITRSKKGIVLGIGLFLGVCLIGSIPVAIRDVRQALMAIAAACVAVALVVIGSATKTVVSLSVDDEGMVLAYPRGREQRVPWSSITSGRITYASIGKAAPGRGRTRSVQLRGVGFSITVTDAEFNGVDALVDAVLHHASDTVEDLRDA